jgi:hypothetical protein
MSREERIEFLQARENTPEDRILPEITKWAEYPDEIEGEPAWTDGFFTKVKYNLESEKWEVYTTENHPESTCEFLGSVQDTDALTLHEKGVMVRTFVRSGKP